MIITETITINGKEFTKTHSDSRLYIRKVGTDEIYSEAIDPIGSGRTYEETEQIIEESDTPAEEADYINALERFGVT